MASVGRGSDAYAQEAERNRGRLEGERAGHAAGRAQGRREGAASAGGGGMSPEQFSLMMKVLSAILEAVQQKGSTDV